MNFQSLQYFLSVAQDLNISRASEKLHISQQALSASIARLEGELGCKLFVRSPSMALTYSGKQFMKSAQKLVAMQKQALTEISEINHNIRGELRITSSVSRAQAILPLILPRFCELYPLAELTTLERVTTQERLDDLNSGAADVLIGITPRQSQNLTVAELYKEHLALVIPKQLLKEQFGRHAQEVVEEYKATSNLMVFRDMPFVLNLQSSVIKEALASMESLDYVPQVRLQTTRFQLSLCYAAEALGATICPDMYLNSPYMVYGGQNAPLRQKVEVLPLLTSEIENTISVCYLKDRYVDKLIQDFVEIGQSAMKGITNLEIK